MLEIFKMVEHEPLATMAMLSALKAKFHFESINKIIELEKSADVMKERINTLESSMVDS